MPIRVTCPECQAAYAVGEDLKGKKIRCRKCETLIPVVAAKPKVVEEVEVVEDVEDVRPKKAPPKKAPAGEVRATRPGKAPPAKKAVAKRREEDDDEDDRDDDRPRPRKSLKKKGPSPVVWAGIGGVTLVVAGVAVAIIIFLSPPKAKEFSAVPGNNGILAPPDDGGFGAPAAPPQGVDLAKPAGGVPAVVAPPAGGAPVVVNPPVVAAGGGAEKPVEVGGGGGGGASGGQRVYPYLLKSVAWLVVPQRDGRGVSGGTGSLVDRTNRLILTNHHVVEGGADYIVFFPLQKDGQIVAERTSYLDHMKNNPATLIHGRVVAHDHTRDLALVQIDRVPEGIDPLQVATRSPLPGEMVHSVGNPGSSDALWVYTSGTVRQVYRRQWQAMGARGPSSHAAQVVETQSPTNPGDSGGPLVNDRGELIAVTQSTGGGQLLSTFIDQSEARDFIQGLFKSTAKAPTLGAAWVRSTRPLLGASGGGGGPRASIPDLVAKLKSPDARLRGEGVQGLAEIGPAAKVALPNLIRLLKDDDDLVRRMTQEALRAVGTPSAEDVGPLLVPALDDSSVEVRLYVLDVLAKMGAGAREALPAVLKLLDGPDARTRAKAVRTAGRIGAQDRQRLSDAVDKALKDADKSVRLAAGETLAADLPLGGADVARLQALLTHADLELRGSAARGLAKVGAAGKSALPALLNVLKDDALPPPARQSCLAALAAVGAEAKDVVPELQRALRDNDTELRRAAIDAAGKLGPAGAPAVGGLTRSLDEKELRKSILTALTAIGPAAARDGAAPLARFLDDPETRTDVLATLTVLKPAGADAAPVVAKVIDMLGEEKRKDVRGKAVDLLALIGKPAVVPLTRGLANDSPLARQGVAQALGQIGPEARAATASLVVLAQTDPAPEVREAATAAVVRIRK